VQSPCASHELRHSPRKGHSPRKDAKDASEHAVRDRPLLSRCHTVYLSWQSTLRPPSEVGHSTMCACAHSICSMGWCLMGIWGRAETWKTWMRDLWVSPCTQNCEGTIYIAYRIGVEHAPLHPGRWGRTLDRTALGGPRQRTTDTCVQLPKQSGSTHIAFR
jgi:hypothetical protein